MATRIFQYANDVQFNRTARVRRSISNSGYVRQEQGSPSYFNFEVGLPLLTKEQFNQVEAELLLADDGLILSTSAIREEISITKFEGTLNGGTISTEGTQGRTVRLINVTPANATVVAGDFIQFGGNNKVYQVRRNATANNGVLNIELHTATINTLSSTSASFPAVNDRTTIFNFAPTTNAATLIGPDSVTGLTRFATGSSARVDASFRLINSSGTNRNRWNFTWDNNEPLIRDNLGGRLTLVDASNRLGLTIRTAFGKDDNQPNRLVSYINQSETRSPANDFSAWGTSGTIFVDGETEGASNALTYNGAPVTGTQTFTANIARRSNRDIYLNQIMINGQSVTAEQASQMMPPNGTSIRFLSADGTETGNFGYNTFTLVTDGGEQRIMSNIGTRSLPGGTNVSISLDTLIFTLDGNNYEWDYNDHVRVIRTYLFDPADANANLLSNIRVLDHQTGAIVQLNTQDLFRQYGFYSNASGNGTGSQAVPILGPANGIIQFATSMTGVTIPPVELVNGENSAQAVGDRIETILGRTYLQSPPVVDGNRLTLTWHDNVGNAALAETNPFTPVFTGQTFTFVSASGGPQQFRTGDDVQFQMLLNGRPSVTVVPGPIFNYYQYDTFNFTEVLTDG